MRYLGQIVAIEKDTRDAARTRLAAAHHALQKPAMLDGISREYQPRVEDGEQLPAEGVRVQATVEEMISATRGTLAELFDVTAARDFSNGPGESGAVADVVVGEVTLVEHAPVPYLLWLGRQLDDLHTFVSKLPTHDPGTEWTLQDPRGVYKATPVQTARQVQQPRSFIAVAATEKHPAQAQVYQENVVVGTWTTIKYTGAIPVARRAEMVVRIDRLRAAVNIAREQANRVVAVEPTVGQRLVSYLFD